MPELNNPGTYMAQIIDCGLQESTSVDKETKVKSKAVGWSCKLAITHRLEGGEEGDWVDINSDGLETWGQQNIIGKDGESINEVGLTIVKDCLQGKWDGVDLGVLQNGDAFKDLQIKVVCDNDTWDGKTKVKVIRMGAPDANLEGGVKKLDDNKLKGLNAKFREKLKAQAGSAATKPAGKKL